MEEQEATFSEYDGYILADSPVALDVKQGDKVTVVWDGVSYDAIVKDLENAHVFGNLAIFDSSMEATDYPFVYTTVNSLWFTTDTAASHTIKVMRQQETITPMSTDFLPVVDDIIISSSTADSTKKFKITVDDSGTIKATEVT